MTKVSPSEAMSAMTPRELLSGFTYAAVVATALNQKAGHIAPAKGSRGLKRAAKKSRLRARRARLQRVTWCAYFEEEKRRAAASAVQA